MMIATLHILFSLQSTMDERRAVHWTAARLVVSLFRLPDRTQSFDGCATLSRFANVPADYPWTYHTQRQVVYLKLSMFTNPWYVGSTTYSAFERDPRREAKLQQIQKQRLAYFEPAVHWSHVTQSYSVFSTIVIQPVAVAVRTLLAFESTYQEILEPRLNSPWVHTLLRKQGVHLTQPRNLEASLKLLAIA